MNPEERDAIIFYGEKKAGLLRKTEHGYAFTYDPHYLADPTATPISLAMPLQKETYTSSELFPFFEGLLPEGWLLQLTSTITKIDSQDKFKLLLQVASNTIGAVSVRMIGQR